VKVLGSKGGILDEYDRNARLKPALLTVLPASLLIAAQGLEFSKVTGLLAGPITAVGFTYVLAQFARDWGKRKQPHLFALWSGLPTTAKLRHRNTTLNPHTRARYHEVAGALIGKTLPSQVEENDNPQEADLIYDSVGDCLREKTRDTKKFPLVFKELVSYGFRRNLWGMKPFGISVACGCIALQILILIRQIMGHDPVTPIVVLALILNVVLVIGWIFVVNPDWVRIPADAYAERLLASSLAIQKPHGIDTPVSRKVNPRKPRGKP
jgi:hypothetical protein